MRDQRHWETPTCSQGTKRQQGALAAPRASGWLCCSQNSRGTHSASQRLAMHLPSRTESLCFSYPTGVLQGLVHVYSAPFFKALHKSQTLQFFFFHLFLALSLPPDGMCFSPPEKQTSTRSARVGGGKHIPGCSSSPKPQMPPNPAIFPVLCTSAQHPGLVLQPREELDRVHSRVLNLISFPLWFQEAKQEGGVATPRAVQPACAPKARQGGSGHASLCSSLLQTKC